METIRVHDKDFQGLIETGAAINAEIKLLETQLSAIKEELAEKKTGKYLTENGHSLTISESPKYSEIEPESAKRALRAKKMGKNFTACVKVVVKEVKRYLSDQELEELRSIESYTRRYAFK